MTEGTSEAVAKVAVELGSGVAGFPELREVPKVERPDVTAIETVDVEVSQPYSGIIYRLACLGVLVAVEDDARIKVWCVGERWTPTILLGE